jgi:hypothetical protein
MISNAESFTISGDPISAPTNNKFYLIATQSFAGLPGAPTPDAIIPAGAIPFVNVSGDTITYDPWDSLTFGMGQLPTDGINSLNGDLTTGVNSPTNYAGDSGSVDASGGEEPVPAASTWGVVVMSLVMACAGTMLMIRGRRVVA